MEVKSEIYSLLDWNPATRLIIAVTEETVTLGHSLSYLKFSFSLHFRLFILPLRIVAD
jgi:hypothetical protein